MRIEISAEPKTIDRRPVKHRRGQSVKAQSGDEVCRLLNMSFEKAARRPEMRQCAPFVRAGGGRDSRLDPLLERSGAAPKSPGPERSTQGRRLIFRSR